MGKRGRKPSAFRHTCTAEFIDTARMQKTVEMKVRLAGRYWVDEDGDRYSATTGAPIRVYLQTEGEYSTRDWRLLLGSLKEIENV